MTLLITNRVFKRSLDLLTNEQSTRIIFNSLEGNYALCLLGKLVTLSHVLVHKYGIERTTTSTYFNRHNGRARIHMSTLNIVKQFASNQNQLLFLKKKSSWLHDI